MPSLSVESEETETSAHAKLKHPEEVAKSGGFSNREEIASTLVDLSATTTTTTLPRGFSTQRNTAYGYHQTVSNIGGAAATLEQYRLQLFYNYALNIERLRTGPQYATTSNNGSYLQNAAATAASYATQLPGNQHHHHHHLALSMSLFPQRIFQPEEPKPQYSYIGLIAMAILSSQDMKLVLSDIYQYILDNYPYFRTRGPGWRNSIRHNLSLNDCFIKSGRSANGKGHYWAIHPANMEDFRKGDFRRRKAQRKVRKHMGLTVDDAGTDSPSPPPIDLTSPPSPLRSHHNLNSLQHFTAIHAQESFPCYPQSHHHHTILSSFPPKYFVDNIPGALAPRPFSSDMLPQQTITNQHQQQQQLQQQCKSLRDQQQQQKEQQQQQQQHEEKQKKHSPPPNSSAYNEHLAIINETTTTIANLYSHSSRKRQFDVASLLEPDVKVDVVGGVHPKNSSSPSLSSSIKRTQHTVITKVSVHQEQQQQQHHHHHLPYHLQHQQHHNNQPQQQQKNIIDIVVDEDEDEDEDEEEQDQDIDVVASDAEEQYNYNNNNNSVREPKIVRVGRQNLRVDEDDHRMNINHMKDDNNSLLSISRHSSLDGDGEGDRDCHPDDPEIDTSEILLCRNSRQSSPVSEFSTATSTQYRAECLPHRTQTTTTNTTYLPTSSLDSNRYNSQTLSSSTLEINNGKKTNQHALNSPANELDPLLFGRYYMAAAAARRTIGKINITLQQSTPQQQPSEQ